MSTVFCTGICCPQSRCFPLLAPPRSPESCPPCCTRPAQAEHPSPQPGAPSAGLCAASSHPTEPTGGHLQPLALRLISPGWHAATNTSAQGTPGTICQEMAREHNPASVTGTGDQECPKRSRGTATEDSWQPDILNTFYILNTGVDKAGISPRAWQCLHCVSPAHFPDLHI